MSNTMETISDYVIDIARQHDDIAKMAIQNEVKKKENAKLKAEIATITSRTNQTRKETLEIVERTIPNLEILIKSSKTAIYKMAALIFFVFSLEVTSFILGGAFWLSAASCGLVPVLAIHAFLFMSLATNWRRETIDLRDAKQQRIDCIVDILAYEGGDFETG